MSTIREASPGRVAAATNPFEAATFEDAAQFVWVELSIGGAARTERMGCMPTSLAVSKVAFLGDYPPWQCGIATFVRELRRARITPVTRLRTVREAPDTNQHPVFSELIKRPQLLQLSNYCELYHWVSGTPAHNEREWLHRLLSPK